MLISYLYLAITNVRNWMFDKGFLKEREFSTPTICIGNLAVGGTGKTPHTELVVSWLLEEGQHPATLSRGYGRKSKGYLEATSASTAEEIGDEPLQMFHHFEGKVTVSVCENRCVGIQQLEERHHPNVIVLDDAYQHRYVKPGLSILLTDYSRLYCDDVVMPAGRLRENRKGAQRADIIVVTKCPENLSSAESADIIKRLKSMPTQKVYFSSITYSPITVNGAAVLVTGIAHPEPLLNHLKENGIKVEEHLAFPDHHRFTAKDLKKIEEAAKNTACIITTAKDFARLNSCNLSQETRSKIIIQDISPRILFNAETELKRKISAYVSKN